MLLATLFGAEAGSRFRLVYVRWEDKKQEATTTTTTTKKAVILLYATAKENSSHDKDFSEGHFCHTTSRKP